MRFRDRHEAAQRLTKALVHHAGSHPLVLAIPRGAVPMGRVIADALEGDLDVVLVRKLGAPGNEELAVGSVDESGWTYVADYAREMGIDESFISRRRDEQLEVMRRRRALYTPGRAPLDPAGRVCIVVDDGLATGATMIAALHSVRARHPKHLVCAVPVASPRSLDDVEPLADETVCLGTPAGFYAVGQFYETFDAVTDEEVVEILRAFAAR